MTPIYLTDEASIDVKYLSVDETASVLLPPSEWGIPELENWQKETSDWKKSQEVSLSGARAISESLTKQVKYDSKIDKSVCFYLFSKVLEEYGAFINADSSESEEETEGVENMDIFDLPPELIWQSYKGIPGLHITEAAESYIKNNNFLVPALNLFSIIQKCVGHLKINISLTEYTDLSDIHTVKVEISADLRGSEAVEMEDRIADEFFWKMRGAESTHRFMIIVM